MIGIAPSSFSEASPVTKGCVDVPVDQRVVDFELDIKDDYALESKDTRQPLRSQGPDRLSARAETLHRGSKWSSRMR